MATLLKDSEALANLQLSDSWSLLDLDQNKYINLNTIFSVLILGSNVLEN